MSYEPDDTIGGPERQRSGLHALWYLVFLAFLFVTPAFNPEAGTFDWVAASVIAAVTAALYLTSYLLQRYQLAAATALMAMAVAGAWLDTAAMGVLPIYAAALVGCRGTRRQVIRRLAGLTVVTAASITLSDIPMPYLLLMYVPSLLLIWLVGLSVHDEVSLNRDRDRLRAENVRIQYLATMTERERIARDLHDLAGQALTAVALRSQLVQRLADADPERVKEEAAAIEETARETLASLRETVAGWQQVGLADELDKALAALEAAGVEAEVSGIWDRDLAPSVETVLALSLREAVTNVVRHAGASHCRLALEVDPGRVQLAVSDDGVGHNGQEGAGLRGMRERVSAAAGTLQRSTGPGTDVRVTIPVGAP